MFHYEAKLVVIFDPPHPRHSTERKQPFFQRHPVECLTTGGAVEQYVNKTDAILFVTHVQPTCAAKTGMLCLLQNL